MSETEKEVKADCYKCVHRGTIPGGRHSSCNNTEAHVRGTPHGIMNGWFMWPMNFDPVWLESCDGFSENPEDKKGEPTITQRVNAITRFIEAL